MIASLTPAYVVLIMKCSSYWHCSYEQRRNHLCCCPCNNGNQYMNVTITFFSNDYFCESGLSVNQAIVSHSNDTFPLGCSRMPGI